MNIGEVIVTGACIILIVVSLVIGIEHITPMLVKGSFDQICRSYMLIAEAHNGLTTDDIKMLEQELTEKGLKDIAIHFPARDMSKRGKLMHCEVSCDYESWGHMRKPIRFVYRTSFLARRIVE